MWDLRRPRSALTLKAHDAEVLSIDWCKYDDNMVATGSVDKSIRVWYVTSLTFPYIYILYIPRRYTYSPKSPRSPSPHHIYLFIYFFFVEETRHIFSLTPSNLVYFFSMNYYLSISHI